MSDLPERLFFEPLPPAALPGDNQILSFPPESDLPPVKRSMRAPAAENEWPLDEAPEDFPLDVEEYPADVGADAEWPVDELPADY